MADADEHEVSMRLQLLLANGADAGIQRQVLGAARNKHTITMSWAGRYSISTTNSAARKSRC